MNIERKRAKIERELEISSRYLWSYLILMCGLLFLVVSISTDDLIIGSKEVFVRWLNAKLPLIQNLWISLVVGTLMHSAVAALIVNLSKKKTSLAKKEYHIGQNFDLMSRVLSILEIRRTNYLDWPISVALIFLVLFVAPLQSALIWYKSISVHSFWISMLATTAVLANLSVSIYLTLTYLRVFGHPLQNVKLIQLIAGISSVLFVCFSYNLVVPKNGNVASMSTLTITEGKISSEPTGWVDLEDRIQTNFALGCREHEIPVQACERATAERFNLNVSLHSSSAKEKWCLQNVELAHSGCTSFFAKLTATATHESREEYLKELSEIPKLRVRQRNFLKTFGAKSLFFSVDFDEAKFWFGELLSSNFQGASFNSSSFKFFGLPFSNFDATSL